MTQAADKEEYNRSIKAVIDWVDRGMPISIIWSKKKKRLIKFNPPITQVELKEKIKKQEI